MGTGQPSLAQPRRGEIWFVKLPSDPPDKNPCPVIVVSTDARNLHPRANTVLVVPLSTTPKELDTHIRFSPGETGLNETCEAQAENIATIRKEILITPRHRLRQLGGSAMRQIAKAVVIAMGVRPEDVAD
jgi:mRNA-degrading endonuclease toxin of MazEF toxin-antitoxin module